ncbi:hypothetical protein BKA65DRAFT_473141 [Rhexocercosporidium sp. MPI-PUGE-AT-0058]|nr:hypothetical protein BKA65DRAFT_473141 [Rhexocercosporidium sp. MPI-PUGE-AT-0058]
MKLTSPLLSAFALIAPSSACLHIWGEISDTGTLTTGGISATVTENGNILVVVGRLREVREVEGREAGNGVMTGALDAFDAFHASGRYPLFCVHKIVLNERLP